MQCISDNNVPKKTKLGHALASITTFFKNLVCHNKAYEININGVLPKPLLRTDNKHI